MRVAELTENKQLDRLHALEVKLGKRIAAELGLPYLAVNAYLDHEETIFAEDGLLTVKVPKDEDSELYLAVVPKVASKVLAALAPHLKIAGSSTRKGIQDQQVVSYVLKDVS